MSFFFQLFFSLSSGTNCPSAAISPQWFQYNSNPIALNAKDLRLCISFRRVDQPQKFERMKKGDWKVKTDKDLD